MNENVKEMSNEDLVEELILASILTHNLGGDKHEATQQDLKFEILRRLDEEGKRMIIDTEQKLRVNLKMLKQKFKNSGAQEHQLYPLFCLHYDRNKEDYKLSKHDVLDMACETLIEDDFNS